LKTLSYYDLLDQFSESGCVVCSLLLRDAHHFLDALLYEQVNDPDIRHGFRKRRGLCNEHSWQLLTLGGNTLGIGLLYRSSLDEVLRLTAQTDTPLNLE